MPTLLQCVSRVESSDNPYAIRFEPSLYASYPAWAALQRAKIKQIHGCDDDTARMIACTSWGRYQLLGCNIYAMGYNGAILGYLATAQDNTASAFILSLGFAPSARVGTMSRTSLNDFAGRYNGPGNPGAYADALTEANKDIIS